MQRNPLGTPPGLTEEKGWGNDEERPTQGGQGKGGKADGAESGKAGGKPDSSGKGQEKAGPCAEEEGTAGTPRMKECEQTR